MLKTIGFLFKKIREYDFLMIPIMIVFTIISSLYPFIWVIVPTKVISLATEGNTSLMVQYVVLGGLLSVYSLYNRHHIFGCYITGEYETNNQYKKRK